jgi:hypothetical protein
MKLFLRPRLRITQTSDSHFSSTIKKREFSSAHFFHSLKHLRRENCNISLPFLVIRLMSLAKHQNVITAKKLFSILRRQQREKEEEEEKYPPRRRKRKITTRRRVAWKKPNRK